MLVFAPIEKIFYFSEKINFIVRFTSSNCEAKINDSAVGTARFGNR